MIENATQRELSMKTKMHITNTYLENDQLLVAIGKKHLISIVIYFLIHALLVVLSVATLVTVLNKSIFVAIIVSLTLVMVLLFGLWNLKTIMRLVAIDVILNSNINTFYKFNELFVEIDKFCKKNNLFISISNEMNATQLKICAKVKNNFASIWDANSQELIIGQCVNNDGLNKSGIHIIYDCFMSLKQSLNNVQNIAIPIFDETTNTISTKIVKFANE